MSHSRKKHPAGGMARSDSDKPGKRRANRATRRAIRVALAGDPARELLPDAREICNAATFPKDGKTWYRSGDPRLMRK